MSETTIPAFKNETEFKNFLNNNLIYLYNPDKIVELNNEISKLENGLNLSNEYFLQLTYFFDLEKQFTVIDETKKLTLEQKEKSKMLILHDNIDRNYELMSEITKDDLATKNLTLIYKHTGKNPIKFIKELNKLGLPNYVISGILNFDPLILLSKEPLKSTCNFNYNDLSEPFKEILQANLVQHAFNVCTQSIRIDNIPPEAFNNPNFIEILYSGNPSYLTISPHLGKLSIKDIENIIQLQKNFCENYFKIRQDPRLNKKGVGMDEITPVFHDNLESLSENLPHKNSSDNYWEFLLNQLTTFYNNIGSFHINSIQRNPQLAAIFAISDFKKYPPNNINENFANELVNILKNYPECLKPISEIFAFYSAYLLKEILNNDFIKNKYPNLEKEILDDKLNFISNITGEGLQNINPKVAIYTNKNDKSEAIKTLISLGNLIDSLDTDVIYFIRKDPKKYGPIVKNIMEAKSIEDITPETINFFANLNDINEAKILLLRFDLFEPIVKKMHEENIEIKKINNVINWTASKFKSASPQKFSDENIYSNAALKNSFLYLISKLDDCNLKILNNFFPKSPKAEKIRKEIAHELKARNYLKEATEIQKQYNVNEISQEEAISKLNPLNLINTSQQQNTKNEKIEENNQNKKRIFSRLSKDKDTKINKKRKLKE